MTNNPCDTLKEISAEELQHRLNQECAYRPSLWFALKKELEWVTILKRSGERRPKQIPEVVWKIA